jgi:anti-sigma-K factor RskA
MTKPKTARLVTPKKQRKMFREAIKAHTESEIHRQYVAHLRKWKRATYAACAVAVVAVAVAAYKFIN